MICKFLWQFREATCNAFQIQNTFLCVCLHHLLVHSCSVSEALIFITNVYNTDIPSSAHVQCKSP